MLKREKTTYTKQHRVEQEIERAKVEYNEALSSVETILQQAARGDSINAKLARQHVKSCVDSVVRNPPLLVNPTSAAPAARINSATKLPAGVEPGPRRVSVAPLTSPSG